MPATIERATKGVFSQSTCLRLHLPIETCVFPIFEPEPAIPTGVSLHLPSGQKSSSNMISGKVTSIGLLIRAHANKSSAVAYHRQRFLRSRDRTYLTYPIRATSPKNVLNTSFRSAIHATDST